MFTQTLEGIVIVGVVGMLVKIILTDFRELRVRNVTVLILLGLYVLFALVTGFRTLPSDIFAALVLSLVGLTFWLLRVMGAGDVKLYFVVGLFIGYYHLALFVILLVTNSVLFVLLLKLAGQGIGRSPVAVRLREIQQGGHAPYAVPMCVAAMPAILLRTFL